MDNTPTIDRSILLPILLGGFSIIGIIAVLFIGRSLNSPPPVSASPSATAFQYIYLGTEPAIVTPLTEESGVPFPTEAPVEVAPTVFFSPTSPASPASPSVGTPIILTQPNTTRTSTSIVLRTNTPVGLASSTATFSTPVAANTYDDTDSRLAYSGGWVSQTGVSGAYQGTLHISSANGNSVTFNFTGQELHLFYQAGPSLGIVTINFDSDALGITLNQAQGNGEWVGMLDTAGSHVVTIRHTSGGSVNIDRLFIPAPAVTVTPTRTSTPNQ